MKNLYLFDIDRTLITNQNEKSYNKPIKAVFGIDVDADKDFSGLTDKLIFERLLEQAEVENMNNPEKMEQLLGLLAQVFEEEFSPSIIAILPGVKNLLEELKKRGHELGLVTGNLKSISKLKLEVVDIYRYFSGGAFGDDPHRSRSDLVTLAIQRAGYQDKLERVYVIGDTELDVDAAIDAHAGNVVVVSNGFRDENDIEASRAEIKLMDFKDLPSTLSAIGA